MRRVKGSSEVIDFEYFALNIKQIKIKIEEREVVEAKRR